MAAQEASKLTDTGKSISQNGTWLVLCHSGAILPVPTMHLSENQRTIAYGQSQAGLSHQDVAHHFGVHVKTIWRLRTRYMQQQILKNGPAPDDQPLQHNGRIDIWAWRWHEVGS